MDIKRRAFVMGGSALCVTFLGGATSSIDFGGTPHESLLIAGSDEFLPYAKKLIDAFVKTKPGIDVVVEAGGTDLGLLALKRGAIDIALASRELKATEDEKLTRSYMLSRDAIALVVNPANPLAGLDRKTAASLLLGNVRDWGRVAGQPGPVQVYSRKAEVGTQKALEKLVLDHARMGLEATVVESGVAMRERIAADPRGLGFLSLHDITPAVKVLAIDGVPMNRGTILSGRYPFSRSFFCITHGTEKKAVREFMDFAQGPAGQALLVSLGLIAVQ
ncbi:phosphate ABC transporter substrate-binding protein [Magnetospirillum sulfuroxidans]|uniref:Phosphate ABC transporter substrate-binding protein n=1 Tax=Magnetospirillum sulfuroxidans TaxID=611300 RepID=A0ABS5I848_9PROT|nr:phosphate ABC transporter substrate-binding protein [Magnetospirillum sulfuroxidans]MBR9970618.1 phosphate ABC transporter substrate-binding protein [Magnetospirillum sulfuroxidans]